MINWLVLLHTIKAQMIRNLLEAVWSKSKYAVLRKKAPLFAKKMKNHNFFLRNFWKFFRFSGFWFFQKIPHSALRAFKLMKLCDRHFSVNRFGALQTLLLRENSRSLLQRNNFCNFREKKSLEMSRLVSTAVRRAAIRPICPLSNGNGCFLYFIMKRTFRNFQCYFS